MPCVCTPDTHKQLKAISRAWPRPFTGTGMRSCKANLSPPAALPRRALKQWLNWGAREHRCAGTTSPREGREARVNIPWQKRAHCFPMLTAPFSAQYFPLETLLFGAVTVPLPVPLKGQSQTLSKALTHWSGATLDRGMK